MILPDNVAQLSRPQPVGQRMRRLVFEKRIHRVADMGRDCVCRTPSSRSPAKAGVHFATPETVDERVPAFAGKRRNADVTSTSARGHRLEHIVERRAQRGVDFVHRHLDAKRGQRSDAVPRNLG